MRQIRVPEAYASPADPDGAGRPVSEGDVEVRQFTERDIGRRIVGRQRERGLAVRKLMVAAWLSAPSP